MRRIALALLCAAVLAGCASPGLTRMRDDIARSVPEAEIGRGRSFSFGPISMAIARGFAGKEASAEGIDLRDVRGVRVGTYPVRGHFDAMSVGTPRAIQRLEERGWTVAVRAREEDGVTWVLYRSRGERITDILTASLESDELALVHVSGSLERVIRDVVSEHADDFAVGWSETTAAAQ
jgi:hypothetical protein